MNAETKQAVRKYEQLEQTVFEAMLDLIDLGYDRGDLEQIVEDALEEAGK